MLFKMNCDGSCSEVKHAPRQLERELRCETAERTLEPVLTCEVDDFKIR